MIVGLKIKGWKKNRQKWTKMTPEEIWVSEKKRGKKPHKDKDKHHMLL